MATPKSKYTLNSSRGKAGASGVLEWTSVDKGIFTPTGKDGFEEVKDYLYQEQTKACIDYARTIMRKAAEDATYKDRKGNLSDSYVFGVYFKGKKVYSEFNQAQTSNSRAKVTGSTETQLGREEGDKFINSYVPNYKKGWEVVWAATMYYAGFLQKGTSRNKQYIVISSIYDDVQKAFGNAKATYNYYEY